MSTTDPARDIPIRGMAAFLRGAVLVAFALAVAGAVLPGRAGRVAAGCMVAVIVAVPLVRVLALGGHWWRLGDRRFAGAAVGLLAIVGIGALLAML
jgi:hypothetical protein